MMKLTVWSALLLVATVSMFASGHPFLSELVRQQQGKVLPICPETIKTFSEQFCMCPQTSSATGACTNLPTFRDGLAVPGRFISALEVAQNLVNPAFINIISAEIKGPGVGVGIMNAENSCHMIKTEYGYKETIVITSGTVQRSRLAANDAVLQGSTDNSGRDSVTPYLASDVIDNAFDCSELLFVLEVVTNGTSDTLRVALEYMFLSEEYPEFVQNKFNDQFRFFIREVVPAGQPELPWVNLAVTSDGANIEVNSVNYEDAFASIFRLCTPNTVYDGHTTSLFSAQSILENGKQYEVRLTVCDVGDGQYDSAVFMKKGSLTVCDGNAASIECPVSFEVCPNGAVPQAFPQGSCGTPLTALLTTPVDTTVVGTITGVTYIIEEIPEISCEFDLTVANRGPIVYNPPGSSLISFVTNGTTESWDGVGDQPRPFAEGETITLNFTLEDDCCETGNTGRVLIDEIVISTFTWVSGDTISLDAVMSRVYGQSATITIEVADCYGAITTKTIVVEIDVGCEGLGAPVVNFNGGALPEGSTYPLGSNIVFNVLISQPYVSWSVKVGGVVLYEFAPKATATLAQVTYTASACGTFDISFNFFNLCEGDVSYIRTVVVCDPVLTPPPEETPNVDQCDPGFAKNPLTGVCEKTCANDGDCVYGGACSGVCLPTGFCEDGAGQCKLGCCKATPGNIPGTIEKAICSNGCGANSCCFENIESGCNSLNPAPELEVSCTALYGEKKPCTVETEATDCAGMGIERCIFVKNGKINDSYCSASCTAEKGCQPGYRCAQFTQSYYEIPAIYGP
eukprot:CAMPEP_0182442608 /NCGR_PEP_ID=MMETSP1172-20130603/1517_1 /TAXON_ID=708627 /ORGANISM="Timspurckia oligopyrenoides, Strain CCMP3278" /LENGTH=797 /DNA_ID=CAMNT_0024637567 /DNA_START=29 /DNA_END=2418 /DNA_ORIENTATION=+